MNQSVADLDAGNAIPHEQTLRDIAKRLGRWGMLFGRPSTPLQKIRWQCQNTKVENHADD